MNEDPKDEPDTHQDLEQDSDMMRDYFGVKHESSVSNESASLTDHRQTIDYILNLLTPVQSLSEDEPMYITSQGRIEVVKSTLRELRKRLGHRQPDKQLNWNQIKEPQHNRNSNPRPHQYIEQREQREQKEQEGEQMYKVLLESAMQKVSEGEHQIQVLKQMVQSLQEQNFKLQSKGLEVHAQGQKGNKHNNDDDDVEKLREINQQLKLKIQEIESEKNKYKDLSQKSTHLEEQVKKFKVELSKRDQLISELKVGGEQKEREKIRIERLEKEKKQLQKKNQLLKIELKIKQ